MRRISQKDGDDARSAGMMRRVSRMLRAVTDGTVRTAKRRRQGRGSSRGQMQCKTAGIGSR